MTVYELVNQVARLLGRPAILEDRLRRMVAFSPQADPIDEVRQETILRQQSSTEVMSWLDRIGVYRAAEATHVPANTGLGMLPRVCIPVQAEGFTLGHLWFIDAPHPMQTTDIERARRFASRIADAWPNTRDAEDDSRYSELLTHLLTGPARMRSSAAQALAQRSPLLAATGVRAIVVRPLLCDASQPAGPGILRRLVRRRPSPIALAGVIDDAAVFVDHARPASDNEALATLLTTLVSSAIQPDAGVQRTLIGLGEPVAELIDTRRSYRQALDAARIHEVFGEGWPVADWSGLHTYRGVHAAWEHGIVAADFHDGIDRLAAERDGDVLIQTLRCYLDMGARAQDAATHLHVHRSSLYHRLVRIEALLGVDLQNGVHRLGLHMALLLDDISPSHHRAISA
ncbi:PucR family transcriptional regulator [Microbacterium sp. YY-01]|uniref:PucR family transcriptional regulator n=1 Tax=Microbacterium sp. YY-01 TaxID=3421634 RepID=UPI003D178D19